MKKITSSDIYYEDIQEVNDILPYCNLGANYVFRGQSSSKWELKTSFERIANNIDWSGYLDLEDKLLFEFKRKAHHYIKHLPSSSFEWLALMQHYGCPTRLLDFTRSFWIALFFAINGASEDSAVWAIDTSYYVKREKPNWKDHLISSYIANADEEINHILNNENFKPGVIFAEPKMLNQRLSIQQGLFAFPSALHLSFWDNLSSHTRLDDTENEDNETNLPIVYKIKIPVTMHGDLIQLLSSMNISNVTLFPGLSGFAKSLTNHIRFAENHEKRLDKARKDAMDKHLQSLFDYFFNDEKKSGIENKNVNNETHKDALQ